MYLLIYSLIDWFLPWQKTAKVHTGADASLWCPLHHFQRYAVHRGVWSPLADPDALWDAVQLLPGKIKKKISRCWRCNSAIQNPLNINVPCNSELDECLTFLGFQVSSIIQISEDISRSFGSCKLNKLLWRVSVAMLHFLTSSDGATQQWTFSVSRSEIQQFIFVLQFCIFFFFLN